MPPATSAETFGRRNSFASRHNNPRNYVNGINSGRKSFKKTINYLSLIISKTRGATSLILCFCGFSVFMLWWWIVVISSCVSWSREKRLRDLIPSEPSSSPIKPSQERNNFIYMYQTNPIPPDSTVAYDPNICLTRI